MHNAFLNIDNKKMSKSLGNFFTVRDIAEKYDLQVLRFFMLSAHYRSPLNFSAELMEAAKSGLERIVSAAIRLRELLPNVPEGKLTEEEKTAVDGYVAKFEEAMDDDFNTADAIAAVFELVKYANIHASETSTAGISYMSEKLQALCDILGIITEKQEELLAEDIEALIAERQAARKAKNFARADEIRGELLAKGIVLEDTREGVKWKKA